MSDKAIKVAHCKAGTIANIALWEDVTVLLDPNNGSNQAILVAMERDSEPFGKVVDWYLYDDVYVRNDHAVTLNQVIQITGTFRYLKVVTTFHSNEDVSFTVSGKVAK